VRIIMMCSVLAVLLCVSFGSADLIKPRAAETRRVLLAGLTRDYVDTFKKNDRALAIVSGGGDSRMGLYVFDRMGNCLAKDDFSSPATGDDLIVEWYPSEEGRYCVALRNAGFEANTYRIALR
jgi:hypothetical protein